jgi:hypothetical protein
MSTHPEIRVSDAERQAAADRLKAAHDEGRLDLLEYDRRLQLAYQAVTARDLGALFADLPASPAPRTPPAPLVPPRSAALDHVVDTDMHLALKILWTLYGGVVLINLTVWLLVSLNDGPAYFWPMWLAVPGVVLAGATVGVGAIRANRAERRRRLR